MGYFLKAEAGVEMGADGILRQRFDLGAFHALGAHIVQAVLQQFAPDAPALGFGQGADAGGMADVHRSGLVSVRLGGTVTAGAPLTSDADGKAIVCAPATGEKSTLGRRGEERVG